MSAPHRLLAAAAGVLGLMALAADLPRAGGGHVDVVALARAVERGEDHVPALTLAAWIRDRKPGLRVVDVRDSAAYAAYHLPTAENLSLEALASADVGPDETLVLYSEGGTHAAQGWLLLRARGVDRAYFLREGLYEWLTTVLNPTISEGAEAAQLAAFDSAAALSRYFGGVPRIGGDDGGDAIGSTGVGDTGRGIVPGDAGDAGDTGDSGAAASAADPNAGAEARESAAARALRLIRRRGC